MESVRGNDLISVRVEDQSRPRAFFWTGVKSMAPMLIGLFPFALIAGVSAAGAGLPPVQGMGMALIVFAGASQLAALDLIRQGAPWIIVVLTALIINLRFTMYSASLAPHFKHLRPGWKGLLAYLLTDQAFATSIARFRGGMPAGSKRWFFFGAAVTLWVAWLIGNAAGLLIGANAPSGWSLDFAVPLTFLALLVPAVKSRSEGVAALTAGLCAVLAVGLPLNLGLITAALVGIVAGLAAEWRRS